MIQNFIPITRAGQLCKPGDYEAEPVGSWVVHRSMSVGLGVAKDGFTVSKQSGERVRGGFTSRDAANDWARISGDTKPYAGDVDLANRLVLQRAPDAKNVWWLMTSDGTWVGSRTLIGEKYANKWYTFYDDMLRGKPAKPPKSQDYHSIVTNKKTGEKIGVSSGYKALQSATFDGIDTCVGGCKCRVEPDGCCPQGWPSRLMALGIV